jgi:hypothetical protein
LDQNNEIYQEIFTTDVFSGTLSLGAIDLAFRCLLEPHSGIIQNGSHAANTLELHKMFYNFDCYWFVDKIV